LLPDGEYTDIVDGLGLGGGGVMVNGSDPEVPPPGAVLTTEICTVPWLARSPAETNIVSWALFTKPVGFVWPFHCTKDLPETKFSPTTEMENNEEPATTELGSIDRITGAGIVAGGGGVTGCVILNTAAFDVPPPGAGLNTVTNASPTWLRSANESDASILEPGPELPK
jgi:hypothetical protein